MNKEIVYFELNNWECPNFYPDEEPFETWFSTRNSFFYNDQWIKDNKLCVVESIIDQSLNFCVTATKEWVEANCPRLLTHYRKFLREPDENGEVYGQWGDKFLPYAEENIGRTEIEE